MSNGGKPQQEKLKPTRFLQEGSDDDALRAELQFRKLLEAAPDAILEIDEHGRIVLLNETAVKMFGYARNELLGLSVDALVPAAMRAGHSHHRGSYSLTPTMRPMGTGRELNAQRKDGSLLPVEISLSPNRGEHGLHVIAVVRDISERKEYEDRLRAVRDQYAAELSAKNDELRIRNREIEKANRLKSEFLASMSHELRTPLHTIIGFSELLGEELEGSLNLKQKRFVGHILQDSRHLLELINGILDLSKIEAGRFELEYEVFQFSEVVEEVFAGIRVSPMRTQPQIDSCDFRRSVEAYSSDQGKISSVQKGKIAPSIWRSNFRSGLVSCQKAAHQ